MGIVDVAGAVGALMEKALRDGILFTGPESMLLAGDTWRIVIELNVSAWSRDVRSFQSQVNYAGSQLRAIAEKFPEFSTCLEELEQVRRVEDELVQANEALTGMLPHRRSKRGLVDLGGKLIKYIFGNPDAEDYAETQARLTGLEQTQAEVTHLAEAHLTVTRKVGARTEQAVQAIERLASLTAEEIRNVRAQMEILARRVEDVERRFQLSLNVSSLLRNLEITALKALIDFRTMHSAIEHLASGNLGVSLLTPLELSSFLKRIVTLLPPGLELFTGTEPSDVYQYYDIAEAHAVSSTSCIHIFIDIPLVSQGRMFHLFYVRFLPVKDHSTRLYSLVKHRKSHFAISEDRAFYAELEEKHLTMCRKGSLWVCPATFPLFSRHEQSCLASAFLESNSQHCVRMVLTKPFSPVWLWDSQEKIWVYSIQEIENLVSHCQTRTGSTTTEMKISGIGKVKAAYGCTLSTQRYRILPNSRGESKVDLAQRIQIIVPTGKIDTANEMGEEDVATAVEEIARQGIIDRGDGEYEGVNVDLLLDTVRQLRKGKEYRRWTLTWVGIPGTTIVILAILAILWVWKCRSSGSGGRSSQPPTEESSEDVKAPTLKAPTAYTIYKPPKTTRRRLHDDNSTEDDLETTQA